MTDTPTRSTALRDMLLGRRRELHDDVQRQIRDRRTDRLNGVNDELERSDGDLADDVEFALIQMKAETVSRIDAALERLEARDYGRCFGCGVEIAETRLRALPFAVRCRTCEDARERGQALTRRLDQPQASQSRFSELVSS